MTNRVPEKLTDAKPKERRGKSGSMEAGENQEQVSFTVDSKTLISATVATYGLCYSDWTGRNAEEQHQIPGPAIESALFRPGAPDVSSGELGLSFYVRQADRDNAEVRSACAESLTVSRFA